MHGDIPDPSKFRKPGDPTPEETQRIVDSIMKPFKAKHESAKMSDTDAAITKSKVIHLSIVHEAQKEVDASVPLDEAKWRSLLMDAYRINFQQHLSREELIEVLAVMHSEMALGLLR